LVETKHLFTGPGGGHRNLCDLRSRHRWARDENFFGGFRRYFFLNRIGPRLKSR
jgi:hypothetical protein